MSDRHTHIFDAETLAAVRAIWTMLVGTALLLGAAFWLIPHLGEDGSLSRDDMFLAAGFAVFGGVVAFPSIVFQALGKAVQAWRDRKGGD